MRLNNKKYDKKHKKAGKTFEIPIIKRTKEICVDLNQKQKKEKMEHTKS